LRTLVSMSATGSVNLIVCFSLSRPFAPHYREPAAACYFSTLLQQLFVIPHSRNSAGEEPASPPLPAMLWRRVHLYHEDFETPGISPRNASPRKHRRQMPNLRRKARGRPHSWQRLCRREENFGTGCFFSRAASNFFSIFASLTRFAVVMKSLNSPYLTRAFTKHALSAERHAQML
jgi:hypothetical protein